MTKYVATYNKHDDLFKIESFGKYLKRTKEEVIIGDTKLSRVVVFISNSKRLIKDKVSQFLAEKKGETAYEKKLSSLYK